MSLIQKEVQISGSSGSSGCPMKYAAILARTITITMTMVVSFPSRKCHQLLNLDIRS